MKFGILTAAAVCLGFAGAASAESTQFIVDTCIKETRAPGAYSISVSNDLPQVAAGEGASAAGARNVNDCLTDKYAVQYGWGQGAPTVGTVPLTGTALEAECKRIRNRRIGSSVAFATGFALGVGDSLRTGAAIGGLIGIGITTNRETRTYKECIASSGTAAGNRARLSSACTQGGPMVAGNGYCVRR